jgi:hypothetical protein
VNNIEMFVSHKHMCDSWTELLQFGNNGQLAVNIASNFLNNPQMQKFLILYRIPIQRTLSANSFAY